MNRLDIPGIGRVAISPHALERMHQRGISRGDISDAILSSPRAWKAAFTLADSARSDEAAVRVRVGNVTLVLGKHQGEVCIVTMFWGNSERRQR